MLSKIDDILSKIDIALAIIDKNIDKNTNILYKIINKIDYCRVFVRNSLSNASEKERRSMNF